MKQTLKLSDLQDLNVIQNDQAQTIKGGIDDYLWVN